MSKQGNFLIYCVEIYKNTKDLTGKQVAELFTRYHVWEHVYRFSGRHPQLAMYRLSS